LSALTAKLQQSNSVSVGKESRSESNWKSWTRRGTESEREGWLGECTWLLLLFALVVVAVVGYC